MATIRKGISGGQRALMFIGGCAFCFFGFGLASTGGDGNVAAGLFLGIGGLFGILAAIRGYE